MLPSYLLILFFALEFVWAPPAFAQNSAVPQEPKWSGGLEFGLNLSRGNSDTLLTNIGGKVGREKNREIWRAEADARYGEDDSKKNVEEFNVELQYKRLLNQRAYFSPGIEFSRDGIADLKYRFTFYAVLGYFFIKESEMKWSVEVGPAYNMEKQGQVAENFLSLRFEERLEIALSPHSNFFHNAGANLNIEETDDFLLKAEIGIEALLIAPVSIVFSIEDSFDNRPAQGKRKNDIKILTSLLYKF